MSSFSIRFDRDWAGWHDRSELTLHLEDWQIHYTDQGIEARPQPISLLWRVCTAVLFLGIAGYLAFWCVQTVVQRQSAARRQSLRHPVVTRAVWLDRTRPTVRLVANPMFAQVASPSREVDTRELQRLNDRIMERLGPAGRQRMEELLQESVRRQQESQIRSRNIDRVLTLLMWIGYPLLILLIVVFGWVGVRFGLLEVIRYPIDRLSIQLQSGSELVVRRPGVRQELMIRRPITQLSHISCQLCRMGRRQWRTYHWMATLHCTSSCGLPRIVFFVESQADEPSGDGLPPRTARFLRRLHQLTRCRVLMVQS
ncbi:MAG: hypothetical protein KatS3mg111_0789 [Pirellulaceae bacterium]|nr:MAG: hypothetical protein KatS3mg111_0789 [Pirellulaceae bacterium]